MSSNTSGSIVLSLEEIRALAAQKWAKVEDSGLARNRCDRCRAEWRKNGGKPEEMPPDWPPDPDCKDPCPVCGGPLRFSRCPF